MNFKGPRHASLAIVLCAAVSAFTFGAPEISAGGTNRAGVVIRYSNGSVEDMCVFFDEAEITGYQLLERSGIDFEDQDFGFGRAICKIGPEGCDTSQGQECFCDKANSWNYLIRNKGDTTWDPSPGGANSRKVRDGYLDGWSWGPNGAAPKPPAVAFSDVCPGSTAAKSPKPSQPSGGSSPGGSSGSDGSTGTGGQGTSGGTSGASPDGTDPRELNVGRTETERLELREPISPEPAEESPASARVRAAQRLLREAADGQTEPPNYLMFGGFAAIFALLGGGLYFMRRRRARSDT